MQEYPQDAEPDYIGGEGFATYDKEEKELLRLQIDVSDLLEDFEHRVLRGQIRKVNEQSGKEEWVPISESQKPIINEFGIREVMGRLIGKITKAAKLTNKTDEEIYKDMFFFDMSITELFAKRSDFWEMDIETAKALKDAAVELVWDIAASARDGFTAINLRSQYQKSDVTRSDSSGSGQKSFLGIPIGGKKL